MFNYFVELNRLELVFLLIGFLGQGLFASRFIFQWIYSEKKGESSIPVIFWYLSIFGGIVFILLFNSSINIFSQIALVILIGISTKNSILIVDWANQLRSSGKNIQAAVLEACTRRFRAIIMTSLSTMIAMVPLLIGNIGPGAGEASRLAVGSTIFGGMLISTFFTLYVTPAMYLLLAKNTKRIDVIDLQLNKELKK